MAKRHTRKKSISDIDITEKQRTMSLYLHDHDYHLHTESHSQPNIRFSQKKRCTNINALLTMHFGWDYHRLSP